MFQYIPNALLKNYDGEIAAGIYKTFMKMDISTLQLVATEFESYLCKNDDIDYELLGKIIEKADIAGWEGIAKTKYVLTEHIRNSWINANEYNQEKILDYLRYVSRVNGIEFIPSEIRVNIRTAPNVVTDVLMSIVYGREMGYGKKGEFVLDKSGVDVWNNVEKDGKKNAIDYLIDAILDGYNTGNTTFADNAVIVLYNLRNQDTENYELLLLIDKMYEVMEYDLGYAEYISNYISDMGGSKYQERLYTNFSTVRASLLDASKTENLNPDARSVLVLEYDYKDGYGNFVFLKWDMARQIPYYAEPYSIDRIRYVIFMESNEVTVGYYTNGAEAIRVDITVKVIDKLTGKLVSSKTFRGNRPPDSILSTAGQGAGAVPWDDIIEYFDNIVDQYVGDEPVLP